MRYILLVLLIAIGAGVVFAVCSVAGEEDSLSESSAIAHIESLDAQIEETEHFITQTAFDDHENLSYYYQRLADSYKQKKELHEWLVGRYDTLTSKYQDLANDYEKLSESDE